MNSRNTSPETTQALLASLEALASECPSDALLSFTVRTWLASPARADLLQFARSWGIEDEQLAATVASTATGLDTIERRRVGWRTPQQIIGDQAPPTLALLQLAIARRERISGVGRRRRLDTVIHTLERAYVIETRRAHIQDFLQPPAKPVAVDLSWLRPLSSAANTPDGNTAA